MSFSIKNIGRVWLGQMDPFTDCGFINAFSCRQHGQSNIVPGELNLALHIGDDPELVRANRRIYAEALGLDPCRLTTCAQMHGTKVVAVTEKLVGSGALNFADTIADTDALITNLRNVPLFLFYADCVPVLLADTKLGAIGLAHAGWRGSVGEIALKTVQSMQEHYGCKPADIIAGIGPSICSNCYEVDDKVLEAAPKYRKCFTLKPNGKYQLDIWRMNNLQLEAAGILSANIYFSKICTCDNHELFFSYRAERGRTGRMGTILCRR